MYLLFLYAIFYSLEWKKDNLGTQIRCPQNWYTDIQNGLYQPLTVFGVRSQIFHSAENAVAVFEVTAASIRR